VRFYQRLLARDANEASDMLKQRGAVSDRVQIADEVILPALALANQHHEQWEITTEDLTFITKITAEIMELEHCVNTGSPADEAPLRKPLAILPARSAPDQLVAALLCHALQAAGCDTSVETRLDRVIACEPRLVIIVTLSRSRGAEVRRYCRQLRTQLGECQIVVLRPGLSSSQLPQAVVRFQAAGADSVTTRVADTLLAADEYAGDIDTVAPARELPATAAARVAD
jgi:hypothetical protein